MTSTMQIVRICALVPALAVGTGCALEADVETATTTSALTTDDVDFAPECQGIIGYTNWAPFQELDAYLPVTLADALIARRTAQPFVSLADISSVPGIAQARLKQLTNRAYNLDFIDVECAGVYEELAVSYYDRAAILTFVNSATEAKLSDVARYQHDTVAAEIIAARPITTLQQLVDLDGVGPSTFRAIRDAAIDGPFDVLANKVNSIDRDVTIKTAFDWFSVLYAQGSGHTTRFECFGIAPSIVTGLGGTVRPNLATGPEVVAELTNWISYADRYHEVGSTTAGLADLSANTAGQSFFGCYINSSTSPWGGVISAFFVNTVTGYRVFTETTWQE